MTVDATVRAFRRNVEVSDVSLMVGAIPERASSDGSDPLPVLCLLAEPGCTDTMQEQACFLHFGASLDDMEVGGRITHLPSKFSSEHAAFQLITVIAERDAALLEKSTALAEKEAACAERDAALLQRDAAVVDRDLAITARDAAVAALARIGREMVPRRGGRRTGPVAGPTLLERVGLIENCSFAEEYEPLSVHGSQSGITSSPGGRTQTNPNKEEAQVGLLGKRKLGYSTTYSPSSKPPKKSRNWQLQQQGLPGEDCEEEEEGREEGQIREPEFVNGKLLCIPIPFCSCTGMNQQCYRWGSGGWQSACCTTMMSTYPLPMNPKKKGSRLAGRKMSAGAFEKLLEKLLLEGVNVSHPVDLKEHWAKHGTNRYVTLR